MNYEFTYCYDTSLVYHYKEKGKVSNYPNIFDFLFLGYNKHNQILSSDFLTKRI